MRWTHHFFSAVQFFQVLLLTMGGAFCMALPFAPSLRVIIANLFLFNEAAFFYLGGLLLIVGIILGTGFYFLQRHITLQISMDPPASIEREVIAGLVNIYLHSKFPSQTFKTEALIGSDGSIDLISNMPSFSLEESEKHLQEMEAEVGELLKKSINYQKKFTFTFMS
jgi:hypothetical protein